MAQLPKIMVNSVISMKEKCLQQFPKAEQ